MDSLGNLLALYAGIILCNLGLAFALWWRQRARLQLALCLVWGAGVISFAVQGALTQGPLALTVGFSSSFLTNLALALLLAELTGLRLPVRPYLILYGIGVAISSILAFSGSPFWLVALPTALCIAVPLAHTSVRALQQGRVTLTTTGKAFIVVCFAFIAHNLDFPFLRMREDLAAVGFTIALLIGWALSMTALAVVLERVAEERAKIEELDKVKTRFFANVSHELRTPLTLILSPIERLLEDPSAGPFRQPLQLVHRNAQRLLRLIDDILDLSKLEAGALRLRVAELNLASLAQRVVELHMPGAEARAQTLTWEVRGEIPEIFGDPHRLEMVLTNLVGNAIKYVPEGGSIEIVVEAQPEAVRVLVRDDGPGIDAERQAQVFDRFVQGSGSGSGGVGIGLALAKELAELHGGSLRLRSTLGQGTTFILTLPVGDGHFRDETVERRQAQLEPHPQRRRVDRAEPASDALDSAPTLAVEREEPVPIRLEGGRRPRVLVVEDEADLRSFIRNVLASEFDVTEAVDGQRALELFDEVRPDLVLTDVMMPVVTGTELCVRLKSDPVTRGIPVVLLTARSGVEAALEGYSAGADDFVAKPFHPRVLLARIRSHLTVRQLGLQLADQARLATAGSLAAGVAHEVRNPLNAVSNAAQVLSQLESSVPPQELLEVIVDGVRRINSVIEALDEHARPAEDGESQPCNVQKGIEATLRLLQFRTEALQVEVSAPPGSEVFVPARAFHQVLTNLLDNAVRAARTRVDVQVEAVHEQVQVRVVDDGSGVPRELEERVFDPFFTTRDVGQGRGLGLYLSRRMCRDVGGDLWVERAATGGACFVASLPRAAPPDEERRAS